jgi:hypothetical protein
VIFLKTVIYLGPVMTVMWTRIGSLSPLEIFLLMRRFQSLWQGPPTSGSTQEVRIREARAPQMMIQSSLRYQSSGKPVLDHGPRRVRGLLQKEKYGSGREETWTHKTF